MRIDERNLKRNHIYKATKGGLTWKFKFTRYERSKIFGIILDCSYDWEIPSSAEVCFDGFSSPCEYFTYKVCKCSITNLKI